MARRHGAARRVPQCREQAILHRNDPAHIAEVVRETVAIFGADRCLFGSNFPIEKLWTRYDALVDAYRNAAETLPPEQQRAILHDTAMRVYRISS